MQRKIEGHRAKNQRKYLKIIFECKLRQEKSPMRNSVLFSYKVARNLMQLAGDVGSTPSMAVATHILFGMLDEKYFPSNKDEDVEKEPTAFQYFLAQNYKAELGKLED